MEGVSTLTFPGQFRSLYHHFNVTVDHWKLQKHGITLTLKSSDTRASFVKTHSYVCRRLLRITWRWHRSSTSSTVRWAAPSRWDCGIVRLGRGEIVRLLRKKFPNWWNSQLPLRYPKTESQQAHPEVLSKLSNAKKDAMYLHRVNGRNTST